MGRISLNKLDDAGVALQLLACTRQIQQGVERLADLANAGSAALDYEHGRNALGQLADRTRVRLSGPYRSEADRIHEDAVAVVNAPVAETGTRAASLVRRADRLYRQIHSKSERTMPSRSLTRSYLIGTDVLTHYAAEVVGRRGGAGGGWHHGSGGWMSASGRPVFDPPGEVYPILDVTDEDVIGELESLIESDWGVPGMPIATPEDAEPGKPLVLVGHGGHHRHRGGWGGRGWGWGYPWGPPLDYGYTQVVTQDTSAADAALAEAIQKNTELQRRLHEREERDLERAREKKPVVGHGRHGGGAQGFYRGGWFGGDYPPPFAYVGPYEDVDTALDPSAGTALAEVLKENESVERKLDAKGRQLGGSFEDFDNRTVWFTGKMRGGR